VPGRSIRVFIGVIVRGRRRAMGLIHIIILVESAIITLVVVVVVVVLVRIIRPGIILFRLILGPIAPLIHISTSFEVPGYMITAVSPVTGIKSGAITKAASARRGNSGDPRNFTIAESAFFGPSRMSSPHVVSKFVLPVM
jgi:hypothetical protein